jgi:Homeodomain-like domain
VLLALDVYEALRRWQLMQPHVQEGVPLIRAAADAGVPLRTAQRWLSRYRAEGLVGLVRPLGADRGRRRFPASVRGPRRSTVRTADDRRWYEVAAE